MNRTYTHSISYLIVYRISYILYRDITFVRVRIKHVSNLHINLYHKPIHKFNTKIVKYIYMQCTVVTSSFFPILTIYSTHTTTLVIFDMHDCATAYQKNKLECVNQLYSNRGAKNNNNNNKWLVETVYRNSMNVNYLKALTTIRSVQFFYFINILCVCLFSIVLTVTVNRMNLLRYIYL